MAGCIWRSSIDFFSVLLNIVRLENLRGIANASKRDMIFKFRRLHKILLTQHALKLPLLKIFLFVQLQWSSSTDRILVRIMDV